MAEKPRKFDRKFKEDAILASYRGRTLKDIAKEIGVLPCALSRWRREYEKYGSASFLGPGYARVHPNDRKRFELSKECRESELRYEILKDGSSYLFQNRLTIYEFIKINEKKYSIKEMCNVLEIGLRGYFKWKKHGISERRKNIIALKKDIASIYFLHKKQYGKTKITRELQALGYAIKESTVSFYMKELGLRRITARKFKKTTDSNHNNYVPKNILNGIFKTDSPSKVWVSDITYIQTDRGFLYLTIIMDLYDRKIIGWSCSSTMQTRATTLPAFEMAVNNRKIKEGLIFHSDRGVQYANESFSRKLELYGCTRSMSRKGTHWDNAVCESFFSSFKKELIYRTKLLPHMQLKAEIFNFIENWYNKKRRHSSLDYQTIEEFNAIQIKSEDAPLGINENHQLTI